MTGRARNAVATLLLGTAAVALGCASPRGCDDGNEAEDVACRTAAAREQLEFGMSRESALALLGRAEAVPPWPQLGEAPATVANPYDEKTIESALGEEYQVVRYFVAVERVSKCPFLQGRIQLEPLVFFEGKLVGWRWAYVADLLERPIRNQERVDGFGVFCDRLGTEPAPES